VSLLLVVFSAAGIWFFASFVPSRRQAAVDGWRRDLSTRAEIRRDALQRFFADGLADAEAFAIYPLARQILGPESSSAPTGAAAADEKGRHLQDHFDGHVRTHRTISIVLWDARGDVAVKSRDVAVDDACATPARDVIASGGPAMGFHLHEGLGPLLTFSAPVRSSDGGVLGVVAIAEDPRTWLFPILSQPLAGTITGESLLVGRDGADALYLTPLRGRPDAPLSFRRPLDDPELAARRALEGSEAVGRYVDYRGVRVLATGRRIPPSPWALVVKIDEAEAMAEVDAEIRRTGLALTGLLVATLGIAWGLRQKRKMNEAHALAESEARLVTVLDQANDAVFVGDSEGNIRFLNRVCEEMYGYPVETLRGRALADFPIGGASEAALATLNDVFRLGHLVFESEHVRANGSPFPVEVSARIVEIGGEKLIVAVVRDISERKRAETRILHLNRLLKTIGEINQLIVHADDRKTLIGSACRVLVEHGGFRMAWIGFVDPRSSRVVPEARAGDGLSYLDGIEIRSDDMPLGRGPAGTAVRTGRHVVVPNLETDASVAPWRERMLENGFRAIGAFPLSVRGEITGVLTVYRSDLVPSSDEETALLDELAGDIGYAIEVLEIRDEKRSAEEALRLAEERFRIAAEASNDVIYEWDLKDGVAWYGDVDGLLGYGAGEFPRTLKGWTESVHPEDLDRVRAAIEAHLEGRAVYAVEYRMLRKDGVVRWWSARGAAARQPDGTPYRWVGTITDITDRRLAETALRESESRFRQLAESMPQLVWTCKPDGSCDYLNRRWVEYTGVPETAQLGFGWLEQLHPDDRTPTVAAWETAVAAGADFLTEFRIRRHDGEYRWFETRAVRLRDAEGRTVKWYGTNTDIGDRRAAEETLRTSRERLLLSQRAAGLGHFSWDIERNVNEWSDEIMELYGLPPGGFGGKHESWRERVFPDDVAAMDAAIERSLVDGDFKEDFRIVRPDGAIRWLHSRAKVFFSPDGRPLRMVGVNMDITDRKRAEEALLRSEGRYRSLNQRMLDGFVIVAMDGRISEYNDAFCALTGYAGWELKTLTYVDLTPVRWHEMERRILEEQVMPRGYSDIYEKEYRRKDGTVVPISLRTHLERNERGEPTGMWAIVRDVTEKKLAEEKLLVLNETLEGRVKERTRELEAANREMEAFSYSVSHDLRAPLRAMDGFSRILLEDHEKQLDAEGKRLLGVVRTNTVQMANLIDDLLSFSRIGRQEMARTKVDMEGLARTAFEELGTGGEMVSFTVGPLPRAHADPSLMRQLFLNLISNALKFTAPKARRVIEVGARTEPERVVYWVKDNGVGFDKAYANKLFGVFQRLHSAAEFEGTGVGLALVQRIVHRHGGEVWGEGKVGEGATFSFSLPIKGGL
jgi:PAS domain S-box-containing protein